MLLKKSTFQCFFKILMTTFYFFMKMCEMYFFKDFLRVPLDLDNNSLYFSEGLKEQKSTFQCFMKNYYKL